MHRELRASFLWAEHRAHHHGHHLGILHPEADVKVEHVDKLVAQRSIMRKRTHQLGFHVIHHHFHQGFEDVFFAWEIVINHRHRHLRGFRDLSDRSGSVAFERKHLGSTSHDLFCAVRELGVRNHFWNFCF